MPPLNTAAGRVVANGAKNAAGALNNALKPTVSQKATDYIPTLIYFAKAFFSIAMTAASLFLIFRQLNQMGIFKLTEAAKLPEQEVREFTKKYSEVVHEGVQYGQLTRGEASFYLSKSDYRMREILVAMKKDQELAKAFLWSSWSPKEFLEGCENVKKSFI